MTITEGQKVASIVADAGGRVVGRTRLQKIAYLLSVSGFDDNFSFRYKHYGPFSESLANAARVAKIFGEVIESEHPASWGGTYSVFSSDKRFSSGDTSRAELARMAADADAIELELAATAVFLHNEGYSDPWAETARRKPEKARDRLDGAKTLLENLSQVKCPVQLPTLIS